VETLPVGQLHARLRQIGAQPRPDRSSNKSHVYFSGPLRKWVRVRRHPSTPQTHVVVDYHNDCPCALEDP
jgi:hypothetical protein